MKPTKNMNVKKANGKNIKSIHDVIKPLYYISRIACTWPYKYGDFDKIAPLSFKDNFVSYAFLAVISTGLFWTLYTKVEKLRENFRILICVNMVFHMFGQGLGMQTILSAIHTDLKKNFFLCLDEIHRNNLTGINEKFNEFRQILLKQIVLLITACVIYNALLLGMLSLIRGGFSSLLWFGNFYITQLIDILFFIQMTSKLQLLIMYLHYVNRQIHKVFADIFDRNKLETLETGLLHNLRFLSKLFHSHGRICRLILGINESHGKQVLLFFCTVVMSNLYNMYGILVDIRKDKGDSQEILAIAQKIIGILYYNGLILVAAAKSSRVRSEVLRTGLLVGDVLTELENKKKLEDGERWLKKKLKHFLLQVRARNPQISGVGIVDVDFRIISAVVGAVTSYFIIILQFKEYLR